MHELALRPDDEGEPRLVDLDLAERLGYEHPNKIRELITPTEVSAFPRRSPYLGCLQGNFWSRGAWRDGLAIAKASLDRGFL